MTRKIIEKIPPELLQLDLDKLRQKALGLGATDARIIAVEKVLINEQVRAKCLNPKCPNYGICGNCPPYTPDLETVRRIIAKYQYAIFIMIRFPSGTVQESIGSGPVVDSGLKCHEIVAKVEAAAFQDGYYLAMGLGAGSCKPVYCPDVECRAIKGEGCRAALKARYSMESWGLDAFLMAAREGWDIFPIEESGKMPETSYHVTLGLVLIY